MRYSEELYSTYSKICQWLPLIGFHLNAMVLKWALKFSLRSDKECKLEVRQTQCLPCLSYAFPGHLRKD